MSDLHPLDHPDVLDCDLSKWTPVQIEICMAVASNGRRVILHDALTVFLGGKPRVTMRHPDITSNCGSKVGSPREPRREPEADKFIPIDVATNNIIRKLRQMLDERARKS